MPHQGPAIENQLQDILDQQWHDNTKARVLDKDQANAYVIETPPVLQAQETVIATSGGKKPRMPRSLMKQVSKRRRSSPRRSAGRKQPGFNVSLIKITICCARASSITCVGSA